MPRYSVTPWKYLTELLRVRDEFYASSDSLDQQIRATQTVRIWRLRCAGAIPHAIDCTALFIEARINDDRDTESSSLCHSRLPLRCVYAMALHRFVTGYCDTAQSSLRKTSMLDLADKLDFPVEWIELRHAIAHGHVPELPLLRRVAQHALTWLWNKFWQNLAELDLNHYQDHDINLDPPQRLLKAYRDTRIQQLKSNSRSTCSLPLSHDAEIALNACVNSSITSTLTIDAIIHALIAEKMLIPASDASSALQTSQTIWSPFISAFHQALPQCFLPRMLDRLISLLHASSHSNFSLHHLHVKRISHKACINALCFWIQTLFTFALSGSSHSPECTNLQIDALIVSYTTSAAHSAIQQLFDHTLNSLIDPESKKNWTEMLTSPPLPSNSPTPEPQHCLNANTTDPIADFFKADLCDGNTCPPFLELPPSPTIVSATPHV